MFRGQLANEGNPVNLVNILGSVDVDVYCSRVMVQMRTLLEHRLLLSVI